MVNNTSAVKSSDQYQVTSEPSKTQILGFAVLIILGIGGLAGAGIGAGGLFHAGALSSLGQVNSIVMIVIGGGGGIPFLAIGIICFVKQYPCSIMSVQGQQNIQSKKEGQVTEEQKATEQQGERGLTNAGRHINQLPIDALAHIFHFFTCKELMTISLVCKKWRDIAAGNKVWQSLFADKFGKPYHLQMVTSYKSEYKKYRDGLLLQGHEGPIHEESVHSIACGTDSIVSCDNKQIKVWFLDTNKCITINIKTNLNYRSCIAMENRTIVLHDGATVQVFKIEENSLKNDFSLINLAPCLTYEHSGPYRNAVAINGDLIATAGEENIQVWNYNEKTHLNTFNPFNLTSLYIDKIIFLNDKLICRNSSIHWTEVNVISLTGQCLRSFRGEEVSVYKNWIVIKKNIYSADSGDLLWTVGEGESVYSPYIVHNNVLIFISCPDTLFVQFSNDHPKQVHQLPKDWIVKNMSILGDDLIVCALYNNKESSLNQLAKVWKFSLQAISQQ